MAASPVLCIGLGALSATLGTTGDFSGGGASLVAVKILVVAVMVVVVVLTGAIVLWKVAGSGGDVFRGATTEL